MQTSALETARNACRVIMGQAARVRLHVCVELLMCFRVRLQRVLVALRPRAVTTARARRVSTEMVCLCVRACGQDPH